MLGAGGRMLSIKTQCSWVLLIAVASLSGLGCGKDLSSARFVQEPKTHKERVTVPPANSPGPIVNEPVDEPADEPTLDPVDQPQEPGSEPQRPVDPIPPISPQVPRPTNPVNDGIRNPDCEHDLDDGEPDLGLLGEQYDETIFGKKFNRNFLESVVGASLHHTVTYIAQTGVRLFRAPAMGSNRCQNLQILPTPPADLQAQWERHTADQRPSNFTLGIFYSDFFKRGNLTENAIVIRQNVDKWTVVHEFMHHNFYHTAKRLNGFNDDKMWREVDSLENQLERSRLTDMESPEGMHKTVALVGRFVEVRLQVLQSYALEEVTIEAQLRALYDQRKLKNVSNRLYGNAGRYIESSYEKAKSQLNELLKRVQNLERNRYDVDPNDRFGAREKVMAIMQVVTMKQESVVATMRQILPNIRLSMQQTSLLAKIGNETVETHQPCSHEKIYNLKNTYKKTIFD